ncbi:type II secretion system protein [Planctomycetota bacterium]
MNRHIAYRRVSAVRSGGFTMVELLVVVAIIAMLAAMMLGAVHVSREAAREMKTESTIRKIDGVVTNLYDSYRTRRAPIFSGNVSPDVAARARLVALRDIMRMEMPERWADVTDDPVAIADTDGNTIPRPALSWAYLRRYRQSEITMVGAYGPGTMRGEGRERLNRYSSAECLYMIVGMAGGADARGQFHENETGDADGDGLLEFHDGWGNPILFLRWAPGLTGSPLQTQVFFDPEDDKIFERNAVAAEKGALMDHDPFDSRNVQSHAYRLVPYIYSAGPDGIYDINFEGGYTFTDLNDPYSFGVSSAPEPNEAGIPVNSWNQSVTAMDPPEDSVDPLHGPKMTPDTLDHFDNIDNHRLEAR